MVIFLNILVVFLCLCWKIWGKMICVSSFYVRYKSLASHLTFRVTLLAMCSSSQQETIQSHNLKKTSTNVASSLSLINIYVHSLVNFPLFFFIFNFSDWHDYYFATGNFYFQTTKNTVVYIVQLFFLLTLILLRDPWKMWYFVPLHSGWLGLSWWVQVGVLSSTNHATKPASFYTKGGSLLEGPIQKLPEESVIGMGGASKMGVAYQAPWPLSLRALIWVWSHKRCLSLTSKVFLIAWPARRRDTAPTCPSVTAVTAMAITCCLRNTLNTHMPHGLLWTAGTFLFLALPKILEAFTRYKVIGMTTFLSMLDQWSHPPIVICYPNAAMSGEGFFFFSHQSMHLLYPSYDTHGCEAVCLVLGRTATEMDWVLCTNWTSHHLIAAPHSETSKHTSLYTVWTDFPICLACRF